MTGEWYPGFHAARGVEHSALVDARTGATRSYAEVDALANRMAHLLRRLGLGVGDHVCFWFDNDVDYPALWNGARYAGLHFTLVSTRLTVEETAYIVQDSGSRVVLLGRRLAEEHGAELPREPNGKLLKRKLVDEYRPHAGPDQPQTR